MRNAITTTPRTGAFAGVRVSTNQDGAGLFTRLADGSWRQHTGTGQTPVFLTPTQLAAWLRRHYPSEGRRRPMSPTPAAQPRV